MNTLLRYAPLDIARARKVAAPRFFISDFNHPVATGRDHWVYTGCTAHGRAAALKILRPDRVDEHTPADLDRTYNWVTSAEHSNVLTVHDWFRVEVAGQRLWAVLTPIVTETLADRTTPLPPYTAAVTFRGLTHAQARLWADGLVNVDAAHASNIGRRGDGWYKLLDLYRLLEKGDPRLREAVDVHMDVAAPELLAGQRVTEAAAVFATCVTLAGALTGRPQFTAASRAELAAVHRTCLPLDIDDPRVPAQLADVVFDGTDPDPRLRPTLAQLSARLGTVAAQLRRAPAPRRAA